MLFFSLADQKNPSRDNWGKRRLLYCEGDLAATVPRLYSARRHLGTQLPSSTSSRESASQHISLTSECLKPEAKQKHLKPCQTQRVDKMV